MRPPIRIDSHSNGAGQIINSPNPSSRIAAPVRRLLGSKSKMRVIALSNNAAAENDITKPSAIIAGRILPVWPTDAPSRIGSIGSVQGAATVTTPASRARTRLSIGSGPSNHGPRGHARTLHRPSLSGAECYFVRPGPRHVFVRLLNAEWSSNAERPGGGHPVRVAGG